MTCIDDIPIRESIDPMKNNHGDSFIEFLMECKMCITNGRITPEHDGFTSISTRGKAVVDYIAISQENISNCLKCEVRNATSLIEELNLHPLSALALSHQIIHLYL